MVFTHNTFVYRRLRTHPSALTNTFLNDLFLICFFYRRLTLNDKFNTLLKPSKRYDMTKQERIQIWIDHTYRDAHG